MKKNELVCPRVARFMGRMMGRFMGRFMGRMIFLLLVGGSCRLSGQVTSQAPPTSLPRQIQVPQPSEPDLEKGTLATAVPPASLQVQMARGTVFYDQNADRKWNEGELPAAGIKVSNGVEIVKTDENGRYEIALPEDTVLFVIKPSGYQFRLDDQNLPMFYYIHKPSGSPQLKFRGSPPTGPLPDSIDFPLYPQTEPEQFSVILFGDPQPRNLKEVEYIGRDVIMELVGNPTKSVFGVSLGDLAFDNLDTLEPLNQVVAFVGIPWYNVIGNHDINSDVTSRKHINETFERIYGPSWYSFDYGKVHFVVMDNIDWNAPTELIKQHHYKPNFGEEQLEFLKRDLAMIPDSQMVVLMMHVPVIGTEDRQSLYRLIENRPLTLSISGHTHDHRHVFIGTEDGYNGKQPHHHIINVTVSGSWWSGQRNENGIPHSTMHDGAPNGYSILTFDGTEYRLDFKAAGKPADEQMRIHFPPDWQPGQPGPAKPPEFCVNVYNGSEKSTVEMAIDDSETWVKLEKRDAIDPTYQRLFDSQPKIKPETEQLLPTPRLSYHLWFGQMPEQLKPGTHLLRIRSTDMHGRIYHCHRSFRVE